MMHEAPPASDGNLGSPRRLDVHGIVSLVLFIVFLVFLAGLLTGVVNGHGVFNLVRDAISAIGSALTKLLG